MDFYIKNSKSNMTLTLPITPEKYEVEYKIDMETVRLTNFGDVNIPTHHTPITFTLEGLFSVNENNYLNKQTLPIGIIQYPIDYVNLIKKWIFDKDIVRLIIAKDIKARFDLECYIETIQYSEDGETVGDIKYAITFREYSPLQMNTIALETNNKTTPRASDKATTTKQRTYTVQDGDYLMKIARKIYGDANKWTTIYNANRGIIGKNPHIIKVGQKLTIV